MITGWLFDIYCLDDKIVFWIKGESRLYKIEKQWTPSLYVASNSPSKLKRLENHPLLNPFVKSCKKINKIQSVFDIDESSVLQLTLKNSKDILKLAKTDCIFFSFMFLALPFCIIFLRLTPVYELLGLIVNYPTN